jgi:glycogen synthase
MQTMMSAIFFAKVVETVKTEFPDIIHVHGWMAAMLHT